MGAVLSGSSAFNSFDSAGGIRRRKYRAFLTTSRLEDRRILDKGSRHEEMAGARK